MNNKDSSIFGITITCLIVVGAIAVLIPVSPTSAIYGCGSGTFYHQGTNSCETFPEESEISPLVFQDLSIDSKPVDKYPKVKCPVIDTVNYHLDENCNVSLKQPMR